MSRRKDIIANHTIIVWPVSVYDVAKTIHKGSLDVGVLCEAKNYINKWAKYKPVRNGALNYEAQLNKNSGNDLNKWLANANWWKAADGKCGLVVNKYKFASQMIAAWNTNWDYAPPRGEGSGHSIEPFRLEDFNWYDHNAVTPCKVDISQVEKDANGTIVHFAGYGNTLGVMMSLYYSDYTLKLTDFKTALFTDFVNFYFGVVVVTGNTYTVKMNTTPFSEADLNGSSNANAYTRIIDLDADYLPNVEGFTSYIYPILLPDGTFNQTHNSQSTSDFGVESGMVPLPGNPLVVRSANPFSKLRPSFVSYNCELRWSSGAPAGFRFCFDMRITNGWQYTAFALNGYFKLYIFYPQTYQSPSGSGTFVLTDLGYFKAVKLYRSTDDYVDYIENNVNGQVNITAGNYVDIGPSVFNTTTRTWSDTFPDPNDRTFVLESTGDLRNPNNLRRLKDEFYNNGAALPSIRLGLGLPGSFGVWATPEITINY